MENQNITKWTVQNDPDKPSFKILKNERKFQIKGICYAPAPINADTSKEPALGDYFWDTFQPKGAPDKIYNWYSLWGEGPLGNSGYYARNDLNTIKGLGINAIRIYSCLAYQMNEDGTLPSDPRRTHRFTHKQFLDRCHSHEIYVIVDIPMPPPAFWIRI